MARRATPFLTAARGKGWRQKSAVLGVDELRADFDKLDRGLQGAALLVAVDSGAAIVQDVMGQLAPQSEDGSRGHPPGFLGANIGREPWLVRRRSAQVAVAPKKEAFYGTFQETGTGAHPAQPFMRPAVDATRDAVTNKIAEKLRSVIGMIFRGTI